MNDKLQEYLNSLPEADRAQVVKLLGTFAEDVPEDKMSTAMRKAAGLPAKEPRKPTGDNVARKAGGLPESTP